MSQQDQSLISSQVDAAAKVFEWKDRNNNFYKVTEMETRHLYFTLRMIWNHVCPEELQLKPFKKYKFGKFYTQKYIEEAVYHLSRELSTRRDIPMTWLKDLRKIHAYIKQGCLTD